MGILAWLISAVKFMFQSLDDFVQDFYLFFFFCILEVGLMSFTDVHFMWDSP